MLCQWQAATSDTVNEAVAAAAVAQREWAAVTPAERARVLFRASQRLRELNDSIAVVECLDTGRWRKEI